MNFLNQSSMDASPETRLITVQVIGDGSVMLGSFVVMLPPALTAKLEAGNKVAPWHDSRGARFGGTFPWEHLRLDIRTASGEIATAEETPE